MDEYSPKTQIETNLVQQFADLNWSLHQIAVQQHNLMSLINAMTEKLMKEGDLEALSKTLAQPYRALNTLGIYESRKRRAANALQAQLTAMLEARAAAVKAAAAKIGFVHSAPETKSQTAPKSTLAAASQPQNSAAFAAL
jgi:hypothetical protein